MEIQSSLKEIGNWFAGFTDNLFKFLSEKLNINPNMFETKLINLIILAGLLMIVFKFAEKTTKIIFIVLISLLVISTIMSFMS